MAGAAKGSMESLSSWWKIAALGTMALEHVPGESEAYYDGLDRTSLGLIEGRVETCAGRGLDVR